MVSKPDASITYSTSYNSTNVYAHTRGEATAGTDLPNYKEVNLMEIGYPDDWMRDSPNMESGKERFRKAMEK